MITKQFIRNSLIYTVAGSLPMASAIILLPFYLGYLSPDTFGALSIYMGLSLLVQIFVTFGFDASIYTTFHELKHDKVKLAEYVSSAFIFILLVGACTAFVLLIIGEPLFDVIFTKAKIHFYPYGVVSVVIGLGQSVFYLNGSLQQTREQSGEYLKQNFVLFALIAIFTIAGLQLFPDNLIGPLGGRMLAFVISMIWILIRINQQFGHRFHFSLLKTGFDFNKPILAYQLLQWFNGYFDRVLMSFYLPLAQIGIYDLASKCLMGIEFIINGFYKTFYPKVIGVVVKQEVKQSTIEINRYYNGITGVAIIMVAVSVFALPILIEWLAALFDKANYLEAVELIPLIAITYLFRSLRLYMAMPYTAAKYSKPLPYFYTIIMIFKIGLMIVAITYMGLVGAIYSLWISYAFEVFVLYVGVRSRFYFKFNSVKLILAPLLMILLINILEPLFSEAYPNVIHIVYVLLAIIGLSTIYWNELLILSKNFTLKKSKNEV